MQPAKTKAKSISLQDRDLELLTGLFESRVMTSAHVTSLYFNGRGEAAKKRLQKLKGVGFIAERPHRVSEHAMLFLTRKAFSLLGEKGVLQKYPAFTLPALERRARVSDLTLSHELEVMNVKAALCAEIRKTEQFTVAEFTTWPLLNEFEIDGHLVRPDGFIRIHEKESGGGLSEHAFFLEVDCSTETQGTLVRKAESYLGYYKSGGFAEKNGAPRSAYKEYPFRVLMVFENAERRNNMAERLIQNIPPILTQAYLSTFTEVAADPLGEIWLRPVDCRAVTDGTLFDRPELPTQWGYRRQTARDQLIEQRAKKHRLLSDD